ncbi:MAG TPA: DHA2 family efflux MFS transporter permease subunit [Solirubrobacteraceae bacterium]|nr:DHA2 family efflux MFS transporter permease subunit [Solirubrobacteraceae bacterium]
MPLDSATTSPPKTGAARARTALQRSPTRGPLPQTTAVALAYVVAMFMAGMDMHIVNVALPTLGRDFEAPLTSVQWTVIAYLLTLAVVIPASGWLGDRIGNKRTFLIALSVFTVASALCGLAQNLGELIAARALQGIGGGMLTPMGVAMLYRTFPPERRAVVARTLIVPVLVGPGLAPVLGGAFTEYLSWRWVFFVNVPVGAVMIVFSQLFLADDRPGHSGRLDGRGLVLSGVGLSAFMYAISEGSALGWGAPAILTTGIGGLACLVAFARLSLRGADPLLRLSLLSDRLFRATNVVVGLALGAFLGSLYLTPVFLQVVQHRSPLQSGLTTFVEVLGVAVSAQTLGRLYPRLGPRVLAGCAGTGMAAILASMALLDATTSLWWVRLAIFGAGLCNGANMMAVQTAMFTHISKADTTHASAIYNTQRQASIAAVVAVLTTIVAAVGGAPLDGFRVAFAADGAIALLGAVAAWALVRTDDARATMRRTRR